jgi:putative membrane protein
MKPWLHTHRNHFDRVSHFSFGLFLSYPMQEIAVRVLRVTGRWRYYLPLEFTLAASAVYEIMEAGMAGILSPERGEEFVGMQGDMWDSQKDVFVAGVGVMVGLFAIYVVRKRRTRASSRELAAEYAAGAK